jgi:hypothetical protein
LAVILQNKNNITTVFWALNQRFDLACCKTVLNVLASHGFSVSISKSKLAELSQYCVKTVYRAIKELLRLGKIVVVRGKGGKPNTYFLNVNTGELVGQSTPSYPTTFPVKIESITPIYNPSPEYIKPPAQSPQSAMVKHETIVPPKTPPLSTSVPPSSGVAFSKEKSVDKDELMQLIDADSRDESEGVIDDAIDSINREETNDNGTLIDKKHVMNAIAYTNQKATTSYIGLLFKSIWQYRIPKMNKKRLNKIPESTKESTVPAPSPDQPEWQRQGYKSEQDRLLARCIGDATGMKQSIFVGSYKHKYPLLENEKTNDYIERIKNLCIQKRRV